ncbi:MAG: ATP-binding cassette domain-containing protein [Burkholderiales bacterium]|jgi:tungstate transport system ATP-binding protein|nr:ATP-binding cassette domain-containing protein [Nitrosomonadaceae bacterium]
MGKLLPLELKDVSLDLGGKSVLRNISLRLGSARTLAILGANGAGKTALLRVMHGMLPPTSGAVRAANGLDLQLPEMRKHDAMLFQRPVMLRRSALDNVIFGLDADSTQSSVAIGERALRRVGMLGLADRPARTLSGGEQQRVAFARALARSPEVLYLDEPTASIDPQSTRQIEALIADAAESGVTVVMVTHNLAQAKRLADDIAFMHEGRLTERTPADEFFSRPQSAEGREYLLGESI